MGGSNSLTIRGYVTGEVVSALQKAIRRSDEAQAAWWAAELDRSGHHTWVWNRLEVILSEDIGPAWPEGPATFQALRSSWEAMHARRKPGRDERLYLMHAAILLARAPKSRRVDEALWACYATEEQAFAIPDYALDMHTQRGRQMGRSGRAGLAHFEQEAAVLVGEAELGPSPFREAYLANSEDEEAYGQQWSPPGRSRGSVEDMPSKLFSLALLVALGFFGLGGAR